MEVIILKKIILPYSEINNIANIPPPYSILKPDTNSDSPSARSNGARFVSAKIIIIQQTKTVGMTTINNRFDWSIIN